MVATNYGFSLPRNHPHRWQKFARFLRSRERFKKLTFSDSLGERTALVLGQVKVEDHSNEITAIPALLELIDIAGAIITIDAMGTQTEIAQKIIDKKGNYVLSLKANHPTLYAQVIEWFEQALGASVFWA